MGQWDHLSRRLIRKARIRSLYQALIFLQHFKMDFFFASVIHSVTFSYEQHYKMGCNCKTAHHKFIGGFCFYIDFPCCSIVVLYIIQQSNTLPLIFRFSYSCRGSSHFTDYNFMITGIEFAIKGFILLRFSTCQILLSLATLVEMH